MIYSSNFYNVPVKEHDLLCISFTWIMEPHGMEIRIWPIAYTSQILPFILEDHSAMLALPGSLARGKYYYTMHTAQYQLVLNHIALLICYSIRYHPYVTGKNLQHFEVALIGLASAREPMVKSPQGNIILYSLPRLPYSAIYKTIFIFYNSVAMCSID